MMRWSELRNSSKGLLSLRVARRLTMQQRRNRGLEITRETVSYWCEQYDRYGRQDEVEYARLLRTTEEQVRHLPGQRYLNRRLFIRIGVWKSRRQKSAYEANDAALVRETTALAFEAKHPLLKLHILQALRGVSVPVASTLLHFMYPESFPIFDVRARTSLQSAGMWARPVNDASDQAWWDYVQVMRELSGRLGVTLRQLDKALWAYDRYGRGKGVTLEPQ